MVEWSNGQLFGIFICLAIVLVASVVAAHTKGWTDGYEHRQREESDLRRRIQEWRDMGVE